MEYVPYNKDIEDFRKKEIEKVKNKTALFVGVGVGLLIYNKTQNAVSGLLGVALGGGIAKFSYNEGVFGSYFAGYANHKTKQYEKNQKSIKIVQVVDIISENRHKNNLTTQRAELEKELNALEYSEICLLYQELKAQNEKTKIVDIIKNNPFLMDILTIK